MTREIPERDWKVFRDLQKVALGQLCDKILTETRAQIDLPNKTAHEKYLSLFKLLKKRDHDVDRGFNDFRRSTAFAQIGIIHQIDLFTAEELRYRRLDLSRVWS